MIATWCAQMFIGGPPSPGWEPFALKAAEFTYIGYAAAGSPLSNPEQVGTIDPASPHPTIVILDIMDAGIAEGYIIIFAGDQAAVMSALTFVINGVETITTTTPTYVAEGDYTVMQVNSETSDRFVVDVVYNCEFIPS